MPLAHLNIIDEGWWAFIKCLASACALGAAGLLAGGNGPIWWLGCAVVRFPKIPFLEWNNLN